MKIRTFLGITIVILSLPILVISMAFIFLKKNIFDNPDFWYGYMAYFGTACLAMVSLLQNKNANRMNERLIELQKNEFTPTLLITGFIGITRLKTAYRDLENKNDIFITEMRTIKNEIELGYAICLIDEDFNSEGSSIPRLYEIHLKSVNKSVITMLEIDSISFIGTNFQAKYSINKNLDVSINNDETFKLFIYHFSNAHQNLKNENPFLYCRKMNFKIRMYTSLNKVFEENLTVDKHFIKKGFKECPQGNVELMVSSSFEIKELMENK